MPERNPKNPPNSTLAPLTPGERLLTVSQVAQALGCARSTVWRWARCGIIARPLRIVGSSRWRAADILAVIQSAEDARALSQTVKNDNHR